MTEDEAYKVVTRWKFSWMNQDGYFDRAFGVDANMLYDLVDRLVEATTLPTPVDTDDKSS